MNPEKILHIRTGGTIEGVVPEYKEVTNLAQSFPNIMDAEKYITASWKLHGEYSSTLVCMKDSREITQEDREKIQEKIITAHGQGTHKFLITHGTYTMPDTGIFLLDNIPKDVLKDISVVITGAMYPLNLHGGDGLLNLGASMSTLLNMDTFGVKISMHGKLWDPKKVEKDVENLIYKEA